MPPDVATAVIFGRLLSVFHESIIMRFNRLLHMRVMLPASVVVSDFLNIILSVQFIAHRNTSCVTFIQLYSRLCRYIGETGASCYNFLSKSIFHKNMQARYFF